VSIVDVSEMLRKVVLPIDNLFFDSFGGVLIGVMLSMIVSNGWIDGWAK
jgi:hypothetical protein